MPLPTIAVQSCCSPPTTAMSKPNSMPRPRGLWKGRGTTQPRLGNTQETAKKRHSAVDHYDDNRFYRESHHHDNDDEHLFSEGEESDTSTSSARKRLRISESPPTSEASQDEVLYWDYSRRCSPHPERLSKWTTRTKLMDTTSTARAALSTQGNTSCDIEDWEDLKELFAKAAEIYDTQEATETMPLLRGVIHECHRFMKAYHDPSVIFTAQEPDKVLPATTPPEEHLIREWLAERPPLYPPPHKGEKKILRPPMIHGMSMPAEKEKKCKCKDLPTAFYTILGTTLFLFGNLIAQHPELALEGEPSLPTPYWLSAIDALDIGENLPIRTSGRGCASAPQDWRMAIVWGRTLVALAEEVLSRQKNASSSPVQSPPSSTTSDMYPFRSMLSQANPDEPNWPADSPFGLIVSRRPPVSARLSLSTVTTNELLELAQDQFSRGIFHMPHPQYTQNYRHQYTSLSNIAPSFLRPPQLSRTSSSSTASSSTLSSKTTFEPFSRAKELYSIASEVLLLAEKLDTPLERERWAHWADGVFSQMKMESDTDAWRGPLASARGRCCLVMGSARAEELEQALEKEDMEVLNSEVAEDAREALRNAVTFLERAREVSTQRKTGSDGTISEAASSMQAQEMVANSGEVEEGDHVIVEDEDEVEIIHSHELTTLLAEALLTLANLTADPKEREVLYAKAQREGGGTFELDNADDRMDESG